MTSKLVSGSLARGLVRLNIIYLLNKLFPAIPSMAMFADAMSYFDLHMRNININGIIYYETINGLRINCQKLFYGY